MYSEEYRASTEDSVALNIAKFLLSILTPGFMIKKSVVDGLVWFVFSLVVDFVGLLWFVFSLMVDFVGLLWFVFSLVVDFVLNIARSSVKIVGLIMFETQRKQIQQIGTRENSINVLLLGIGKRRLDGAAVVPGHSSTSSDSPIVQRLG